MLENKADLTGGLLRNVEELSGSVDNQKVEKRAPSPQVVVPEERKENGGNEAESSHLAANAGSLSEPIEKEKEMKTSSLYHPVTREEMQKLKETESLFRSNLLKLQVLCPIPTHYAGPGIEKSRYTLPPYYYTVPLVFSEELTRQKVMCTIC